MSNIGKSLIIPRPSVKSTNPDQEPSKFQSQAKHMENHRVEEERRRSQNRRIQVKMVMLLLVVEVMLVMVIVVTLTTMT